MIRDRIVVGIRDSALSERLQLDPDLTLEKAKTLVRQREDVHEQQAILRGSGPTKQEMAVDFVKRKHPFKGRVAHKTPPKSNQPQSANGKCSRCGKGPHPRQSCPAREAVCHNCKKKGHFSTQCFAKSVGGVMVPPTDAEVIDTAYLNTLESERAKTSWITTVVIDGKEMSFKLDTGAEVTVISDKTLKALGAKELQSSTKRLCGPDQRPIEVMGEFSATLSQGAVMCSPCVCG